jgi:hypothetical protein
MDHQEEDEKPKAFKVDDRRRFSAEGELKPEFRAEGEASQTEAGGGEAASVASGATEKVERPESPPRQSGSPRGERPAAELTFETFLVGLSTQALVHLGEIPDPHGEANKPDLIAAQQLIDIIGMLKEKTRGNLDRDEQSLLDAILFELRMKYVERARPPGR